MAILTESEFASGTDSLLPGLPDFLTPDESRRALANLLGTIQQAEHLPRDEQFEHVLILGNNQNDESTQLEEAAGASFTQRFVDLFRESYQEFQQSSHFQAVLYGQSATWTPVLRDASGKAVGGFPPLLVVPTPVPNQSLPILRIEFPRPDWMDQIPPLKQELHRAALDAGRSFTYLDRKLIESPQLVRFLKDYPGLQLPRLINELTKEHPGYSPTRPDHFRQKLFRILEPINQSKQTRQHLVNVLTDHFPLNRVSVHPDIAVISSQRLNEAEFRRVIEPMNFSWPQQRSLLEGGHLQSTTGNSIGFNLLNNGLTVTTQRFAVRQYEPYMEQTLMLMLSETDKKLGHSGLTEQEQRTFQQQYRWAHVPDTSYNPADPIQYKRRLEAVIANSLPPRLPSTSDQRLAVTQQLTTLGSSPANLIRITLPAQAPVLHTNKLNKNDAEPVLTWLHRVTTWVQSIPEQHRQIVNERAFTTTYKGVELSPIQRISLIKGEQVELIGLTDPRRGSLYRASITMDALTGAPQEQKAGTGEQLRTDNPREAYAHQKRFGGGLTAQPTGDSERVEKRDRNDTHRLRH